MVTFRKISSLNRLYSLFSFKDFSFFLFDYFGFIKQGRHVYILKNGVRVVARNKSSDKWEIFSTLSNSEYRFLCTEKYLKILSSRQISIIDAGANIGVFTIFVSTLFNLQKSVLIEPDRDNIEILKENLDLNQISHYTIANSALYKDLTSILFDSSLNNNSKKISRNGDTLVPTITIEKIFNQNDLQALDIFKIDIEGSEWDLLDQVNLVFFRKCRLILIEYHLDESHADIKPIVDYFKDGFELGIDKKNAKQGILYIHNLTPKK